MPSGERPGELSRAERGDTLPAPRRELLARWAAAGPMSGYELLGYEQQTLRRAAQGDADPQLALALLFLRRERPEAAASWFAKAAQQGQADAMHWLGTLLAEGNGIEQDDTLAAEWIGKAAAQDHPIAKAQMAALLPRAF